MSSQLYRLGRVVARRRRAVLVAWLGLLVAVGLGAVLSGGALEDDLTIPGTEAQDGIDTLSQRFPEVSGATGQLLFVAPEGEQVEDLAEAVDAVVAEVGQVADVEAVTDPFDETTGRSVSDDGRHAIATIQLAVSIDQLDDATLPAIEAAAAAAPGDLDVHVGGSLYTETAVHITIVEALGVLVALAVLVVTFGSFLAAGLPLLTALVGIAVSMAAILGLAAAAPITTTAPTLALMIGLAVGIDYALFVLSRHRSQLATGISVEESIARSLATAGSAVVFAGATVIIALCGLFVVGIPFLTVMGLTAALTVAVAVLVALTALPALLAVVGERLRPRPGSRAAARALAEAAGHDQGADDDAATSRGTFATRWVHLVTAKPLVTVLVSVVALLALAVPAKDLSLTLPDNGTADAGTPERVTYELIDEAYGAGYNSPLLVTVDIIASTDPLGAMAGLAADLEQLDGVAAIGISTPNRTADLGIVQLVPETGQSDPATADLVHEIRDQREELEEAHGVADLRVTGQTAAAIDISERLSDALLPFGILVVGLSMVLLTVVFRSIWVPVKATVGYLFSVLAAFGTVAAVFEWGWLADALGVAKVGSGVISFMPIILMGVLFGLAMDYEVFLVSRMREAYVHGADARAAVRDGFRASARVVTAAAVIMIAVFAAFVPTSPQMVKPIALGLAVGVLVDAFAVRMTLVPAVLVLLGDRAWRLPRWLDRRLPSLDVEGAALEHHLDHEAWVAEHGEVVVRAEGVVLADDDDAPAAPPVDAVVRRGQVLVVGVPDRVVRRALLAALTGRLRPAAGTLVVGDRVLPDEAGAVQAATVLVPTWPDGVALRDLVRDAVRTGRRDPVLVAVDTGSDPDEARWAEVAELAADGVTVVVGCTAAGPALTALPPGVGVVPTASAPPRASSSALTPEEVAS